MEKETLSFRFALTDAHGNTVIQVEQIVEVAKETADLLKKEIDPQLSKVSIRRVVAEAIPLG